MNIDSALDDMIGAPPVPVEDDSAGGSFAWCDDMFFVNDHLGATPTLAAAGSQRRYRMWVWANDNIVEFTRTILQQAFKIDQQRKKQQPDADIVEEEEGRGIAELQAVLRRVVSKAKEGDD